MNIKNWIKKLIWRFTPVDYKDKYLRVYLKGGLCNKLHCLFSACDIALKKECILIEPFFGWNEKILFSDIYDLDYFNEIMSQYNDGKQIMISVNKLTAGAINRKIINNYRINLWEYSEKELEIERFNCNINKNSTKLKVLKALKLKPEFEHLVKEHSNNIFTAIQVRTEPDWIEYAKKKVVGGKETLLINIDKLLKMISNFHIVGDLFFTSGDNHKEISKAFEKSGIVPFYFYNSNYEYEINAAINFEICCNAHFFIGLSRSSYSNLISLKRATMLENDNSFIYNLNDEILRRIDKGLQSVALNSVTKKTIIS